MKSLSECPIGSVVFATTEKFEATVIAGQVHISGCQRLVLQEHRMKDGVPVKVDVEDVQQCEMRRFKTGGVIASSGADVIGLKVKSEATGYEGLICVVETRAGGGRKFWVQSAARTEKGDRVDGAWFDEELVALLEPARAPETKMAGNGSVDCPLS